MPGIGPGGGNHPAPSYLAHNAHLHERPQRRLIVDVYVSLLTTYPYDYTSTMVLLLGVKSACKPVRSILRDLAAVSTSLYLPSLHLWLHFFFLFFFRQHIFPAKYTLLFRGNNRFAVRQSSVQTNFIHF